MKHRNWIALAAAMGIALAGCSSMKSADNSSSNGESTNSTMRRADSGSTNDAGATSQPNTNGSNTSSNSGRTVDCTDDANAQNPACENPSTQSTRPEPDATTPNTPPQQ
jgi:hypothetical protein